jgi:hypothetical protein
LTAAPIHNHHHGGASAASLVVVSVSVAASATLAVATPHDMEDIDHPQRAFVEHHPYASGVFSQDDDDAHHTNLRI